MRIALTAIAVLATAPTAHAAMSSKIDGSHNDSGIALLCNNEDAVIAGYARIASGGKESTTCVRVPNGATVQVECKGWNRVFARVTYRGRKGVVSSELLDASKCD